MLLAISLYKSFQKVLYLGTLSIKEFETFAFLFSFKLKHFMRKQQKVHMFCYLSLLIFTGKLKPTIGMITYRNICALDSKGKVAYKLI